MITLIVCAVVILALVCVGVHIYRQHLTTRFLAQAAGHKQRSWSNDEVGHALGLTCAEADACVERLDKRGFTRKIPDEPRRNVVTPAGHEFIKARSSQPV